MAETKVEVANSDERVSQVSYLVHVEEAVRKVREDLRGTGLRRRGAHTLEERLKRCGLWEEFLERVEAGVSSIEIAAWLKRDHGIEVHDATVRRLRRRIVGRRVGKEVLREIDRTDQLASPIRNCLALLRRLEERYRAHVEVEEKIGFPLHEEALKILGLMLEANQCLLTALDRAGLYGPEEVKVGGQVEVKTAVENAEDIMRMVVAALQRKKEGKGAGGGDSGES